MPHRLAVAPPESIRPVRPSAPIGVRPAGRAAAIDPTAPAAPTASADLASPDAAPAPEASRIEPPAPKAPPIADGTATPGAPPVLRPRRSTDATSAPDVVESPSTTSLEAVPATGQVVIESGRGIRLRGIFHVPDHAAGMEATRGAIRPR